MIIVTPLVLEENGIRLEPMTEAHQEALSIAAADGELWNLWFTAVPPPGGMAAYIAAALQGQQDGHMLPWVVRDFRTGALIGSTRYHDIAPGIDRVEIGHTWYAAEASTNAREHDLQAPVAPACLRNTWVQGRGPSHRPFQPSITAGDRGAWRAKGRRHPALRCAERRNGARHGDVQHPGGRVARRSPSSGRAPGAPRCARRARIAGSERSGLKTSRL